MKRRQEAEASSVPNFRLNNHHRVTIMERVLDRSFKSEEEGVRGAEHVLGNKVYDDVYPAPVQKNMSLLPEGFLPVVSSMSVQFGGHVGRISFSERVVAEKNSGYQVAATYEAGHKLTTEYYKVSRLRQSLNEKKEKARRDVRSLLDSCTTSRQLVATWPEVVNFLEGLCGDSPKAAIAVTVREINLELGLSGR